MMTITQKIFCAFCRLERNVCVKKSMGWTNVALSFLAASLLMFIVWQALDARMILFFVIFLAIAEVFVRLRWRMSLPCPHCAFDPLLYKQDRSETVRRVKSHLGELKKSGRYLMRTQNPFEKLPSVVRKPDTQLLKPSDKNTRLLSRQV